MLADYMISNRAVTVYLEATNRRVDVINEGIDVAIRARTPPLEDSDLVLRVLAERTACLVGSPALLAGRTLPLMPADLSSLPSVDMGPPRPQRCPHRRKPRLRPPSHPPARHPPCRSPTRSRASLRKPGPSN